MKEMVKSNPAGRIDILLYHQVGDAPAAFTNPDCFCRTEEFHRQMKFLASSRYRVIPLSRAVELISGKNQIDDNYVVLTFDDGCEGFFDKAWPVLEECGFPSTVYPVVNCLGKYATWGRVKNQALRVMSAGMLTELCGHGVEVGAHTMDHVRLTQVERREAVRQINESRDALQQLTGTAVNSFAYPHGDFNSEIIETVREAGFSNALTCIKRSAQEAESLHEIPRRYVTCHDDLNKFKLILSSNG